MDTKKAIENRRSIRTFIEKDISKEVIEDILDCGRLAPSAKNRQPWYFFILKLDRKNQIAELLEEYERNTDLEQYKKTVGYKSSMYSTAKAIKEAPILIFIYREQNNGWMEGDHLSIGACIENMCLRATSLGIASLWIRDTNRIKTQIENLYPKEGYELNSTLLLGYSETIPKIRPRKKLEEITKWYI